MSLMQAQRQGEKYPSSILLKSSKDLGWPTLLAELHSHSRYEGPGAAAPTDTEVGVVVRGSDEGLLTYKFAGSLQSTRPTTGSNSLEADRTHVRRGPYLLGKRAGLTLICAHRRLYGPDG